MGAFAPKLAGSTSLSVTASNTQGTGSLDSTCNSVRLYNKGPSECFVRWGVGAQTAVTTDLPLAPGAIESFFKGAADSIAAICATGETATLRVTSGAGE